MTTKELSDRELNVYQKVFLLQGTMEEKTKKIRESGISERYKQIHTQYLTHIKSTGDEREIIEGLKRLIFLNWYHIIEPCCFTGIWELDENMIRESYSILNDRLKTNNVDKELKWMISYYAAAWEWAILSFSEKEMPELTTFVKNVDQSRNYLPNNDMLANTMTDRGQMGEYFKRLGIRQPLQRR